MEIPPIVPGHHPSLLISLILRPKNSMGMYGLFTGILWENLAPSWPSQKSLWEFYGIVWVNSMGIL